MIRTLTAVGLLVAIPLGALSAPLVHAHLDELDTDHHRAHEIHAHVMGHSSLPTSPPMTTDDLRLDDHEAERAVSLQLFVAVAQASFDVPAAVVAASQLGTPAEAPARHSLRIVHGHDPPFVGSLASRAPPAFLS